MVLYSITLIPLAEELQAADPVILSPFYEDDAAIDSLARCSAQLLNLLMKRGMDQGYLTKTAKYLFISESPWEGGGGKRGICKGGSCLELRKRQ